MKQTIGDALHTVLDGKGLTNSSSVFERPRCGRDALIDRACWLRSEGKSFYRIAKELGIAHITARKYVEAGDPSLLDMDLKHGGGRPRGGGRLSGDVLRALHREHRQTGCPVEELGRRIASEYGYASGRAAAVAINNGWYELKLPIATRPGSERHCKATTQRGTRCRRFALVDSDICWAHDPARRQRMEAAA